jgi:rod shape-determining protein MreC
VQVAAVSIDKEETGVVTCNIMMASSGLLRLEYLSPDTKLEPGDIITTSGAGGVYPAKLKIGQVESVEKSDKDVSRYAVVRPFQDLSSVTDVQVIIGFPGKGEEDAAIDPSEIESGGEEDAE